MEELKKSLKNLNLQDLDKELTEAEQVLQWLTDNTKNTPQKRFMRSKIRLIKKLIDNYFLNNLH
jgi:hypothetical protein